ncbi:hypothetical protein FVE85_0798 [Porphyridium purpureum]|uniref:Transmembrane protein n=1 Tax=Porphyridium purpureum TaxID=35688 RepID=A0A5J4YZK1_PORPP|nr:hypothetical protein FVE85_0798 [Porphyridium purpureum]|eukprot:POR0643..scf208_2
MGIAFVFGAVPATAPNEQMRGRLASEIRERRTVLVGARVGVRGSVRSLGTVAVSRSLTRTNVGGEAGPSAGRSGSSHEVAAAPVHQVLVNLVRLCGSVWKRMLLVVLAGCVACVLGLVGGRPSILMGSQPAHAATVSRVARVSYGTSSAAAKKSDTQTLLVGTLAAVGVMLVVKTLRSKASAKSNLKDDAEIEVVRYDKIMEEQWKKEDREKKASAAREATTDDIMEELKKRLKDVESTMPDAQTADKPQEMTDIIKSLEQMWGEDKGKKGSDSDSDDNSEDSIRMGSWGGTGSALLEPPSGSTPEPNEQPKEENPPQVAADTLRMLRSCWEASDDEGGNDKDSRKKGGKK